MPTTQKPELSKDPIAFFRKRMLYRLARAVFGVGLALVLVLILIVLIRDMVKQIQYERGKQQWLVERLGAISQLYTDRDKAQQLRNTLETILPNRIEVATKVVPQLRIVAETHNVKIDFRIGADRPAVGDVSRGISFILKLDGSPENIVAFLTQLEAEKLIVMENWDLAPIDYKSSASPQYQLNTAGTLYIRDESR